MYTIPLNLSIFIIYLIYPNVIDKTESMLLIYGEDEVGWIRGGTPRYYIIKEPPQQMLWIHLQTTNL